MTEEPTKMSLLELAAPELPISLKVSYAGRTYRVRHFLRPPASADWFAYEAALAMAVEELPPAPDAPSDEPTFKLLLRTTDAALALWDRLACRVEGYQLPEPSDANSDWRALIPLAHKEAAVRALTLVAPAAAVPDSTNNDSTNNSFPLLADEVPIVLEAVVAGVAYPRLVHRFRPPSVEAERTYRRLLAETLLVRGSRSPRTLIPSRLPALVRLYDRLILAVSGYSLNARPLADPAEIARAMDAWHKRVAVQALFGEVTEPSPLDASAPAEGTATLELPA
ncbi:MAG: hypothetical protein ACE5IP_12390 [Terriglobia bacterium]